MVTWAELEGDAPELAALGEARFRATGLAIVGTLRANGWPRITPVEPRFVDGELQLGMMWRSRKALDLLRDPRCAVHSSTADKDGTEGDLKVYRTAEHVTDAGRRERHCVVTERETGWRPADEEFHVFFSTSRRSPSRSSAAAIRRSIRGGPGGATTAHPRS